MRSYTKKIESKRESKTLNGTIIVTMNMGTVENKDAAGTHVSSYHTVTALSSDGNYKTILSTRNENDIELMATELEDRMRHYFDNSLSKIEGHSIHEMLLLNGFELEK